MQGIDWRKFLLAVVAMLIFGNLANTYYEQRDRATSSRPPSAQVPATELRVLSTSQSADGVAEADLTPQLANAMEKHGVGRLTAKFEALAKQAGLSLPPPQIHSESTVIQTQVKKLIVIRYEINSTSRAVEVIGISGPNLDRVVCTRDTLEDILLTAGSCAQKVHEVHGVRIGG